MSGIATAVIGSAALGAYGASQAAKSSKKGTQVSADAQREQLAYLKEVDKLPREYREAALKELAGQAGIGEGGDQQAMIDRAKESPIYNAIMGGKQAGEETILRQAGATGGLRSGNVQSALGEFGTGLQNQALLTAYEEQRQNLQGLANLPSGSQQIGQVTSNIGQMLGAGEIAAGQIQQQGLQNIGNTALTGLSLGIKAGKI